MISMTDFQIIKELQQFDSCDVSPKLLAGNTLSSLNPKKLTPRMLRYRMRSSS